jgi:hypothetical protein
MTDPRGGLTPWKIAYSLTGTSSASAARITVAHVPRAPLPAGMVLLTAKLRRAGARLALGNRRHARRDGRDHALGGTIGRLHYANGVVACADPNR